MLTAHVLWTLWIINSYIVILGYDDLSVNKTTAQYNSLEYGATNAVDGNINTCTKTTDIGLTKLESDRYTWWHVDLGDVHSVYNIRIQFKDYGSEYSCSAVGVYGVNCDKACPNNCQEGRCDIINGTCLGCTPGWVGEYCTTGCPTKHYGLECKSNCVGHCKDFLGCNHTSGMCDNGCDDGWTGENCTEECQTGTFGPDCVYKCSKHCLGNGTCDRTTGKCHKGCKPGHTGDMCDEGCGHGMFGTDCISRCSGNCLNNVSCNSINGHCDSGCASGYLDDFCSKTCNSGTYGLNCMYNCSHNCTDGLCNNVNGSCICVYEKEGSSNCGEDDHSRVVLNTSSTEPDYINANYIEDVFGKKKYIATQGPKDRTIADFWRMVWQENSRIIVCLTNISEAKTKKCAKYWPDLNDKHMEGDISVRCQKEQTYAENVVRHLRIKNNSENTERDVFMFHYTQWPDHGVPEPLSLVVFHRHVMKTAEEHPMGYIVVHCSAGIGRTGTFIALDALYKEGERTGKVNVPQYVEKMRNARMNMIQGEDQYKTVYLALLEAFRGRLRAVPVDFFLKEFQDHSCYFNHGDVSKQSPFALEFEELLSFRKVYTHGDYKSGMSNIAANYVPSVLPVERYLCPLTTENLYYNAVSLQSFTRCDRFISAQFPLPDYTEHFLTLVKTYYTCTIVSLYPLGEVKSGGSSMRVAVLECKGWEDEYDSKSRRILIDLVQEAKIEERTHPTGRILVLSSDGAKRCGPLCAVFNALEQMMMDEEVDLFTITRQLQTRRPEFLSSLEEYQFCFDTISDYLQNDTLYANI
uniref:protein-tyrosine-phosphatase n=1 Tax=Magallana gigas TaxID=29159 RepID=A0A8W8NCL5_MAGGI